MSINDPIPEDFPHYSSEEQRLDEWKAYWEMRTLLGCPAELDYQAGHTWCSGALHNAAKLSHLHIR